MVIGFQVSTVSATAGSFFSRLCRLLPGSRFAATRTWANGMTAVSYTYDTSGRMTTLATTRDVEGRFATASNDAFSATYAYTPDGLDAGWTVVVTNGTTISRALTRDAYRRSLVTAITNSVDGVPI